MISSKKWLLIFLCAFCFLAGFFLILAHDLDPFIQYHYDDNKRFWGNSIYLNPGIARNYPYDVVIIGSSMAQNFDMDFFRKKTGMAPVKLVLPGITVNEILQLYDMIVRVGRAQKIFMIIDLSQFNREYDYGTPSDRLPQYLYNDFFYDDYKYLLGYDIWLRFIPINLGIKLLFHGGARFPAKLEDRLNLDKIGDWSKDYVFSKQVVINNYRSGLFSTTKEEVIGAESRMKSNIDCFLKHVFSSNRKVEIVFAFPPYSALYWYEVKKEGLFDAYMNAKAFFVERCLSTGTRVADIQVVDEIADLDHYKDTTHYDTNIQAILARVMLSGEADLDADSSERQRNRLDDLVTRFAQDNAYWLLE